MYRYVFGSSRRELHDKPNTAASVGDNRGWRSFAIFPDIDFQNKSLYCDFPFFFFKQELNIEDETIVLADSKEDVAPNDLSKNVPEDKGRYVFYLFKHTFEGDYTESIGKRKVY